MKVTIDRQRCQGHAMCAMESAELFDIDDDGLAKVQVDIVEHALRPAARRAAEMCPERAVTVSD